MLKIPRKRALRVVGLMSGTSADGIDVAVTDIDGRRVRVRAFGMVPYPAGVRRDIFRLFDAATGRVDDVCHMNAVIGELFAQAVLKVCAREGIPLSSIDLIGSHGQTVHHLPNGRPFGRGRLRSTLQIGEPSVIAERTGITTVADFRPRDVAAGGEGAPLVPYADAFLFRHPRLNRALQNIGGIGNVTWLPAGRGTEGVIAFDTGPGNMMIDRAVSVLTDGRLTFDRGGRMALRGRVDATLLAELMRHPFLRRRPPKTTGREQFGAAFTDDFIRRARRKGLAAPDVVATLTEFTAASIADACAWHLPGAPDEVILCGGGARNDTLARQLAERLCLARVRIMDEFGIDADAKEAVSFALLAYATVHGLPSNVPSATGARRPVVLGKIVPA